MNDAPRPWYREPETFIAIAALVVSISAVVVGLYEASLQRTHDRAEVWPHVEIQVFTKKTGAEIRLENTGLGPAIIESVVATVDGQPRHNWHELLRSVGGVDSLQFSNSSAVQHGLRPGDPVVLADLPAGNLPPDFWKAFGRVGLAVCYKSAFGEHWIVESKHLGQMTTWKDVDTCSAQPADVDF